MCEASENKTRATSGQVFFCCKEEEFLTRTTGAGFLFFSKEKDLAPGSAGMGELIFCDRSLSFFGFFTMKGLCGNVSGTIL